MLKTLNVQNYALIDELQLHFGKGMNIITGETGAGKSVLMGALGLLLGDRSDSSALLDKTRKCVIEGIFLSSPRISRFLESEELDSEDEIIIHREINKEGKSRSFINDTPVNLSLLKELGNLLVDIHSQHETLLLNKADFQLSVVDAFSGHDDLLDEYRLQFKKFTTLRQTLDQLLEEESRSKTEQDYLQFQFDELNEAKLEAGEQQKIESELSGLTHAEEIKKGIGEFAEIISGSEGNVIGRLSNASNIIAGLDKYMDDFHETSARLKALTIELKDIEYEIEKIAEKVLIDPRKLEILKERVDLIYRLQQKHRLNSIEELLDLKKKIGEKLFSISSLEEKISSVKSELEVAHRKSFKLAERLSTNRKKSAPSIENKIKKLLAELGMAHAVLKIEFQELAEGELNINGKDRIKFMFSANKGIPFSEISKVASGGELSRLMLALKSSVAKLIDLPTVVFDEIDTGVSGETAFKIGKVMQDISGSHQLIAITHLPQIASRGEEHFFVYKDLSGKKTFTKVKKLSTDERIVEIARMLSGDKPTSVAIENAKELLNF